MSLTGDATVVALITHARRVPALDRERFAVQLRERLPGSGFLLQTCHRVEGYMVAARGPEETPPWLPSGGQVLTGEGAIRHVLSVATGRDSVVIGEDQVLHQLREALASARSDGRLDPILERLVSLALRAGRRARSWRQRPPPSLADLALAVIEGQRAPLGGREILVVGAGQMGRLAVQAAMGSGAAVSIANRSFARAEALAGRTGARVAPFDPGSRVGDLAGVVVALAGPWAIGPPTVQALVAGSAVVVDLSVPAAVPALAARGLGPRLVSADALARMDAISDASDDTSFARLDALVEATSGEFRRWLEGRAGRSAARALAEYADRERQAGLDELWRHLPDLGPEVREAIEAMARQLSGRLLHAPLERLGRDRDGRAERAARDLFAL